MANESVRHDLSRTREVIPSGTDRTGQAPFSMANHRNRAKAQSFPRTFVRENEQF